MNRFLTVLRPPARRLPRRLRLWLMSLLLLLLTQPARAAEYRPLPPAAAPGLAADGWLLHDAAGNRLILYLPGYHAPAHAYYQWVRSGLGRPFRLSFTAAPGLSVFLDNQLLLAAPRAGRYALDLSQTAPGRRAGLHLLAVWQPEGYPDLASFTADVAAPAAAPSAQATSAAASAVALEALGAAGAPGTADSDARLGAGALVRLPLPAGQNVLLLLLLGLGLLYGVLRGTYPAGLARSLQVAEVFSKGADSQNGLVRPAFTWLNLGLALLFALSLALLLAALHTDLSVLPLPLLRQVLRVPESAVLARVSIYTVLILSFLLTKYLLVELLSYIFDLRELVNLHFREFLRTTLLLGLVLPLVLLLYLGLNPRWPGVVGLANASVLLLLTATVGRVGYTLHRHAPLLTLHLLAYLCATEVLPLAVLLKLIVFTYPT